MHVQTEVPIGDPAGLTRVQPHAHADGERLGPVVRRQGALPLRCRPHRVAGAGKRDEEGVTLRVDLHAACVRERVPEQSTLCLEGLSVVLPERFEQPRRALDVGEQERDGARRKVAPHGGRILEPWKEQRDDCNSKMDYSTLEQ